MTPALKTLNECDEAAALQLLEPLIERAPQIARRVVGRRPFASIAVLQSSICDELQNLSPPEVLALLRAHPELSPPEPDAMTQASQNEQKRLDLTSLNQVNRERLAQMNALYQAKFEFPFITALTRHFDLGSVLAEFEARLSSDRTTELERALEEVCAVSKNRTLLTFSDKASVPVQAQT